MILRSLTLGVCVCGLLGAASATMNQLNRTDRAFLKVAAETDMREAHEGRMAENKAAKQDVRAFGQQLVQDQSNSYGELLELGQKTGETIPRGINVRTDRTVEDLTHAKGAQFDRRFIQDEIRNDQQTIALFRREADHGQNPDVKAWAQKTLPTLQGHLQKAKQLDHAATHKG